MNLPAAEFKRLIKKLGPAEADKISLDFGKGSAIAADNLLTVVIISSVLNSSEAAITVPARQLSSVANKTTGQIQLTSSPGELQIKSSKAEWRLGASEYKPVVLPQLKKSCKVSLPRISALLKFAAIAAEAKNQFTYSGLIRLASESGKLSAVATNGKCMTIETIEAAGDPFEFLVPAAAVKAVGSFEGEEIWIGDAGNAIFIGNGNADNSITLIARKNSQLNFPAWHAAIPDKFQFEASVSKDQLLLALDNVSPAVDENKAVQLVFAEDRLRLRAEADGSFADDEMDFVGITPDPVFDDAISFRTKLNHKQLVAFADAAEGDVTFHSRGEMDPTLLTSGSKQMLVAAYRL